MPTHDGQAAIQPSKFRQTAAAALVIQVAAKPLGDFAVQVFHRQRECD